MPHNAICVIPARYASTRLPGKPLIDLGGKPMIVRSWERVRSDLPAEQIIVATDDQRIVDVCHAHGIDRVEMTSPDCRTGTDRVAEVAARYPDQQLWVVAMGDNPLLPSGVIRAVVDAFLAGWREEYKVCRKGYTTRWIQKSPDSPRRPVVAAIGRARVATDDVQNNTIQKMVIDADGNEMFASRRPIPYAKDDYGEYWKQVNVYALWADTLKTFASLPTGENEKRETLEILRLIEHGYTVRTVEVVGDGGSIDVPKDVERAQCAFGHRDAVRPSTRDETLPVYLLD